MSILLLIPSPSTRERPGYVLLLSVLIVGAIGLSVTLSMLLLGVDSSRTSTVHEQAVRARGMSDACAEVALQKIRDEVSFVGDGQLELEGDICVYSVTKEAGEERTVTAVGTAGVAVRKVLVHVSEIDPVLTIEDWREVADLP